MLYLLEFITISLYLQLQFVFNLVHIEENKIRFEYGFPSLSYSVKFNDVLSFIILNTSNNQQSVVLRTNYNILCFVIDIS